MNKSIKALRWKEPSGIFAGESQHATGTLFCQRRRKEGFEQSLISSRKTAENEKETCKVFFQYLEGGDVEIVAAYPAGMIKTPVNLDAAAAGEEPRVD